MFCVLFFYTIFQATEGHGNPDLVKFLLSSFTVLIFDFTVYFIVPPQAVDVSDVQSIAALQVL